MEFIFASVVLCGVASGLAIFVHHWLRVFVAQVAINLSAVKLLRQHARNDELTTAEEKMAAHAQWRIERDRLIDKTDAFVRHIKPFKGQ